MLLERDCHTAETALGSLGFHLPQEKLVAQMHAIEEADRSAIAGIHGSGCRL